MDITGNQSIPAPRDAVWAGLNDPAVLKACLPGCESVERIGDDAFEVVVAATVGPLRARFNGSLRMTEARPPESCVMVFEGQGGVVGFGKGSATVHLAATPAGTDLTYSAQAQVGGKLAQIGSRLVDNVARKMSDDFFVAFKSRLVRGADESPDAPLSAAPGAPATQAVTPLVGVAMAASAMRTPADSADSAAARTSASRTVMVPGWWLGVATVLGALATAAGVLATR